MLVSIIIYCKSNPVLPGLKGPSAKKKPLFLKQHKNPDYNCKCTGNALNEILLNKEACNFETKRRDGGACKHPPKVQGWHLYNVGGFQAG